MLRLKPGVLASIIPHLVSLLAVFGLAAILTFAGGCGGGGVVKEGSAGEKNGEVRHDLQQIGEDVKRAAAVVEKTQPATIVADKPVIQTHLTNAAAGVESAERGSDVLAKLIIELNKKNEELKVENTKLKDDSTSRKTLMWWVVAISVAGALALGAGLVFTLPVLQKVGAALLAASMIILLISLVIQTITTLFFWLWITIGLAILAGVLWEIHDVVHRIRKQGESLSQALVDELQDIRGLFQSSK